MINLALNSKKNIFISRIGKDLLGNLRALVDFTSFLLALALEVVKAIPISLSVKIYVISLRIILYNNNNNKISTQNYVWNQQKETVKREKGLRKRTMVTMSFRSLGFRDWFWVQRKPYSRWFWGFEDPKWDEMGN